jgi:hypothetical protein
MKLNITEINTLQCFFLSKTNTDDNSNCDEIGNQILNNVYIILSTGICVDVCLFYSTETDKIDMS